MAALAVVVAACSRPDPEQQLRDQIARMQAAVEERAPADAMAAVGEDFSGPGGMDRAALHNLLRMQLLANQRVGVTTGPLSLELRDGSATVRFDAMLTGSGRGQWLPDRAQAYEVTTGWRLREGRWQLNHAQWQPRR